LPDYKSLIRRYYSEIWNAWSTPALEELINEGEKVVARLTYSGTHRGELFGFSGTGTKVTYQGIAIFQFREGKIVSGYVLGDTESLKRQIAQA